MEAAAVRLARPGPLEPERCALFLDLDGTLAGLEPHPAAVGPDERRNRLLARLSDALDGRLAIVSGRALDDVDRILGGEVTAVAAIHGLERRSAQGERIAPVAPAGVSDARLALAAALEGRAGLLIEDKGLAFAVHYRGAPEAGPVAAAVAARIAEAYGLEVQPGSMVIELRAPGHDKGDAVEAFMAEPPFAGFVPVFVGDDLTDEDGFRAARALGGYGVLVGQERPSEALFLLEGVEAVMDWLDRSVPHEAAA